MSAAMQAVAVGLALAGSASYGIAAVIQQGAAAKLPSERAFDLGVLWRLVRRPLWLCGLIAVAAGFGLQAAALGLGRLVIIEPALATGLLFALVLAARREQRRLKLGEWLAALAVVAGLSAFLIVARPSGGQRTAATSSLGITAAAVAAVVAVCMILAGRFSKSRRAVVLGIAGGAAAGATDALTKSVAVITAGHPPQLFADGRLYLLIVVGLLTYTIQQNGYRAGGLPEFLPAFAVMEPVSGSFLGLLIYHERLSHGPVQLAVEVLACVAAIWGIARLARSGIIENLPVPAALANEPCPADSAGLAGLSVPAQATHLDAAPLPVGLVPVITPAPLAASTADDV